MLLFPPSQAGLFAEPILTHSGFAGAAQVHLHQWEQAQQTLNKIRAHTWPPRFADVAHQVRELEGQINKGRERD